MILRVLDEMNKDEKVRIIVNAHDLVNARYLWNKKPSNFSYSNPMRRTCHGG